MNLLKNSKGITFSSYELLTLYIHEFFYTVTFITIFRLVFDSKNPVGWDDMFYSLIVAGIILLMTTRFFPQSVRNER